MRILLINQYAGSPALGMEYRPHWMALEWQNLGHDVLVVTADRSHLRRRIEPGLRSIEGVPYRVFATTDYRRNGAKRFANILSFAGQLLRHRRELVTWAPDVVIASSTHPMDVRGAVSVARAAKAMFVYEVHDLWPLTPMLLGGLQPSHPVIRLMQHEEDRAYRTADLVVSLLPKTEEYMIHHGLRQGRWVWIPNGYDSSAPRRVGHPSPALRSALDQIREFRKDWGFILIYAGTHGPANQLDALISAAPQVDGKGVGIVLVGDGPEKQALMSQAAGLPNLLFLDPLPRAEVGCVLEQADAAYVGLTPSPIFDHGISPNKMYDYMGAGLPILENCGAVNSPVQDADCGIAIDPSRPEDLLKGIATLAVAPKPQMEEWSRNGRTYVEEHMDQGRLAQRMIECFQGDALPGASDGSRDRLPRS